MNDTQHNNTAIMLSIIVLSVTFLFVVMLGDVMLNVIMLSVVYAECHYAECHNAESHYAECRYAECRGATEQDKLVFSSEEERMTLSSGWATQGENSPITKSQARPNFTNLSCRLVRTKLERFLCLHTLLP